jgi:hypothetical protein
MSRISTITPTRIPRSVRASQEREDRQSEEDEKERPAPGDGYHFCEAKAGSDQSDHEGHATGAARHSVRLPDRPLPLPLP